MVCTFFGHRFIGKDISAQLEEVLIDLIENKNITIFYVGHQGGFDTCVRDELRKLKEIYVNIKYYVVLSYLPKKHDNLDCTDYSDTIFPDILTKTPPKYAIDRRNRWMINISDFVVCYCEHNANFGAAKYVNIALKKGLQVINLYKQ